MKMFFDATTARATTNAQQIEEAVLRREYAESLIEMLISPSIEKAASKGYDCITIALGENERKLAQLDIIRILIENHFKVDTFDNFLIIHW